MSSIYDNWERLVEATLRSEHDRELAYCESLSSRFSDFSSGTSVCSREDVAAATSNISILSYSGNNNLPTSRTVAEVNATRNFRPNSFIGEGAFGYVFKGWIDEHNLTAAKPGSGLVIAVKKLKPEEFQGHKEWLTEVNYLGQLHHPNLVKLIGYCSEGDNRLLVYEFMPKGSLGDHLFGRGPQPLSWATRIKVVIGAARGLSFLHEAEKQVIHGDFKPSNIFLDGEFNAKLSDFSLAKSGYAGDRTRVLSLVRGTHAYAAPEYVATWTGRLTANCDVYSFGVVFLELLSGRPAVDKTKVGVEQNLVNWAKPFLGDRRKFFRIMDTKLGGQYPQKAAFTATTIALECLSNEPKFRPRMADVLATLEELQAPKTAIKNSKTHSDSLHRNTIGLGM